MPHGVLMSPSTAAVIARKEQVMPVPAPPQTVTVSYINNAITVDPAELNLPNTGGASGTSYEISFQLDTQESVLITEIGPNSDTPPQFSVTGLPGTNPIVTFTNTSLTSTDTFHYSVSVGTEENPRIATTVDPEMMIPPPNG
jgi:hypothetical protein